jgi:hypothetical protein
MGGWITSLEDMIYGEDGVSPIRPTLERVLNQAKKDDTRLRIEIRSKAEGTPNSRQEHQFAADPDQTSADGVMRVLVQRLTESPGEHFAGELRINFTAAGASQERYGSFTRTIKRPPPNVRGAPGMHAVRMVDMDGDEEIDNDVGGLGGGFDFGMGGPQHGGGGHYVPPEQVHQWLETAFGFTFRSMAQQMAMFERATRMMESYTLRFGMPHPTERGITEQRGGEAQGGGGLGLLPMLLNAAQHLASANDPAELAQRAGSMAQGESPPRGAARAAAINGAARLVQGIPRFGQQEQPPGAAYAPSPDGPPDGYDDGGGGAYFDEDDGDYDGGTSLTHQGGGFGGGGDGFDGGDGDGFGPPGVDLRGKSPEEVKALFLQWVREDPSNKQAVMAMLPELASEF